MRKKSPRNNLTPAQPSDKTALETTDTYTTLTTPHRKTSTAEATPSTDFVTASSAPVTTPADPGAPSATSTTIGDGYFLKKRTQKRRRLLLIGVAVTLVILAIIILIIKGQN